MPSRGNPPKSHVGSALHVMDADKKHAIDKVSTALIATIHDYLDRGLPLRRIVLVASILKNCGVRIPDSERLAKRLLSEQKSDGGWVDCEDTAWFLYYLYDRKDFEQNVRKGLAWLADERIGNAGWGFCIRDKACIPITAQILYFLPHFSPVSEAMHWLENQWNNDLHSPINLNYKAAWYLLSFYKLQHSTNLSLEIFNKSVDYLIKEQRDDGSWGPWKNHPAPSGCFITGICMAAIALSYRSSKDKTIIPALKNGIRWIEGNQLENGLFPTHYIEEGSAWILFGLSKALSVIKDGPI